MSDYLMCPMLTASPRTIVDCYMENCAWYDEIDYHCAIVTIADSLANIHAHARDVFAKAYGLDEPEEEDYDHTGLGTQTQ